MKRWIWMLVMACCTLVAEAQTFRVNYQGAKPTISDFTWAFLKHGIGDEEVDVDESLMAMRHDMERLNRGQRLEKNRQFTVDEKNGFILYENRNGQYLLKVETCYWNEADGKHKLFACNTRFYNNGKYQMGQYDGIMFCRYDNATRKMTIIDDPGFRQQYGTEDGATISYSLPRTGKDITMTYWYKNGTKRQKTLKWNGRGFK